LIHRIFNRTISAVKSI